MSHRSWPRETRRYSDNSSLLSREWHVPGAWHRARALRRVQQIGRRGVAVAEGGRSAPVADVETTTVRVIANWLS